MYTQFYATNPFLPLSLFAMLLFVVLFGIVLVKAWRKQEESDSAAFLPLEHDDGIQQREKH